MSYELRVCQEVVNTSEGSFGQINAALEHIFQHISTCHNPDQIGV